MEGQSEDFRTPRNFTELIQKIQSDNKCNRAEAIKTLYGNVFRREAQKPPEMDTLIQNQTQLKGIAGGTMSSKIEDYTSAMLNTLQLKSIGSALGDGGGNRNNMSEIFDKVLLMRMMQPQDQGTQMMMTMLPLIMGGANQTAVQDAMTQLKEQTATTEKHYMELVKDLETQLFQKDVVERQEAGNMVMMDHMKTITDSHERVVNGLSERLQNFTPTNPQEQVQAALTTLGAYQDFLKNTRSTLQGFGMDPAESAKATEAATAGQAKHYLMTQIGNFLGGLGQSFVQGSVGGPPLPPGYQNPPQSPAYYPPSTGMPQPTFDYAPPAGAGMQTPPPMQAPFPPGTQAGMGPPYFEGTATPLTQHGVAEPQPPMAQPPPAASPPPQTGPPPMPQPTAAPVTPEPGTTPKPKVPEPTYPTPGYG